MISNLLGALIKNNWRQQRRHIAYTPR